MFKLRHQIAPIFIFLIIAGYTILMVVSCGDKAGKFIPNLPDDSPLSKINHFISADSINLLRKAFYTERNALDSANRELFITESEGFNKTAVLELLKNPECVGIRIYYGVINNNKVKGEKPRALKLIIVGTNSKGQDLLIGNSGATTDLTQAGYGLEYGQCCLGSTPR